MLSVVILTLNEENNLPACLASLSGVDDIHVLDSGSTDRTDVIAADHGAHVSINPFQNFAQQRNHAHEHLRFRHPWVFHLDADERMTPALLAELRAVAATQNAARTADGFWVAPRMLWQGRWVPHCTDYPAWQARFCHAPTFRFVEKGHGQREADGLRLAYLKNNYEHDMSASGVDDWLAKHRRYARREAEAWLDSAPPASASLRALLSRDALVRRRALKNLSYHLPARPLARLVYQYLLRGGFLDGPAGWSYCLLLARYEGFAAAEIRRLRKLPRISTAPRPPSGPL
ncbi:MAG: glycosyltransferase family 2 protein [Burkholderiales bacterium]|nr:glycosyltransferase family 2 protein [Opitutaceae bacterium]